jgi:hypothetical protein
MRVHPPVALERGGRPADWSRKDQVMVEDKSKLVARGAYTHEIRDKAGSGSGWVTS